ncbi:DUF1376 domain-containing protein [Serratia marcescens]|uniref:DUF1376 domain-containing protein n=1 Tax=Serratia TaxID=613 RepID=UPI000A197425|nr:MULTISPECIES: DUF1376 domain-containing protein [Serratia]NVC30981.1 DUF1376 domain-containing protein [Serratia marcescens]NVC46940.1 DUF1376 domain-containing protein [Serratia marcescens]PHY82803.1 DUF1376 domain-containing protein [Serratia marcescens]PIJ41223.1 hypothetical protein BOM25_16735 [Serratia sp. OPWLW2]QLB25359.1 DUF1376 domain-containing protein [Serratia marcescens]
MAALPYMQFYVADYLADTMHLSTEEHGAYLLLIFNYWQTGKPLPKNRLAGIARLSNDRWTDVERSLNEFFIDDGNTWIHQRIERDLLTVKGAQSQRSEAGKISAQKRAQKKAKENQSQSNDRSTGVERDGNDRSTNKDPDKDKDLKDKTTLLDRAGANDSKAGDSAPPAFEDENWLDEPNDKFPMTADWQPSPDFQQRAALWNRALDGPAPGYTPGELAGFVAYWQPEGRRYHQVQWEKKFADSVLHERRNAPTGKERHPRRGRFEPSGEYGEKPPGFN